MMRFTFKGDITHGFEDGPRSFAVMAENQQGLDAWMAKVGDVVVDAMSVLQSAIAATDLSTPEVAGAVGTYFLTGPTPSTTDILTIKGVLIKTLNGLQSGRIGVKIHEKAAMSGNPKSVAFIKPKLREIKKDYHNIRQKGGEDQRVGAIHLRDAVFRMGSHLVTRIMIHESTHKYASTADYSYYSVPKGVQLKPMTKAEALNNADSYAMYAMTVGFASITPTANW